MLSTRNHMTSSIPIGTLEKFTTFGDLLRFLRRRAGITQMELAIAVGYSDAQISRLEQNLRLPDIPTVEARFVPALGLEDEPKVVSRLLDLAANVRREDAPGLGLCPYKGLNFFDEADADLFVGREALTAKLTERLFFLTRGGTRFLAIVGASGSGKSSIVRAGLVPALRWDKSSADWNIQVLTPTVHPLESLAASLTQESHSVVATASLMDDLAREPRSLQIFAKRKLGSEHQTHLLLVIDQFEELFALCRSEEEKACFIGNLLTASSEADGPVSVVVTLRADFYAHCANYVQLREALAQNQEYIGAMNHEELRRAIEEPARRGRWELEAGLVDLLLRDVGQEPGALPLLSHALFETWQRRRGRTLTISGYISSGGVRGAIAETAETVFTDRFTREQQAIARRIFLRLTELSDEASTADTRRRANFNELILKPEEAPATHDVLKKLADARLIITSEDSAEVAHEALIREWPTLRGWLEENREGLRLHRQLTVAAQEWQGMGSTPDMLFRGARLAQAQEWASAHADELNEAERAFLTASIENTEREAIEREAQRQRELEAARKLAETEKQHAEEQARSARQLRKRAVYLAGALVIALAMAVAAIFFGRQAQTASRLAASRELAAASIANLEIDPERSVLLALEALNAGYTIEAEDALHRAVQASRVKFVIPAHEPGAASMVAFSPAGSQFVTASADETVRIWDTVTGKQTLRLEGHFAAYSPDGKQLAIVAPDGIVRMYDPVTGKQIQVPGQIDAKLSVTFSPEGTRLLTVAFGNLPKIWDLKTGRELTAFPGHTDFVSNTVFSPDGTRILTASDDGTARIWDARSGDQLLELNGHAGFVWSAAYSPNGGLIVTASGNEAYVWDAGSGKKLFTLAGHKNEVFVVAFSPDSARIATGGLDRKIKIWDAASGEELFSLPGHVGAIYGLSFSPDGTRLASSSDDGTVRVWDGTPSREFLTLPMRGSSGQIAYGGDGTRLAATNGNGTIKIWDAHTGKDLVAIPGTGTTIKDLAFSPDGSLLFSAGIDSKLTVWDPATGRKLQVVTAHSGIVNGLAISPDATRLASASDDYKAKIWDISNGILRDEPTLSRDHPGGVLAIAFNKDGSRLVTGAQDGAARIWDTVTGQEILTLRGHIDSVLAVGFNPDGTRVAAAAADGAAKVWDSSTGEELLELTGHTNAVTSIAFSPDGTRIATASRDGTAKLWDAVTGDEMLTFDGDGSGLSDIGFSPDGKLLATGGENSVRVYLLNMEDLIALASTRVTRDLTSEECQKYLHRARSACEPVIAIPTTTAIPVTDRGRVCQVTNTGGLYDNSFNEVLFKGMQDSTVQFGWDARVLQSASTADYEKNIREFLRGDCDLIVGVFPMMDAMKAAALGHRDQKFMFTDFPYDPPIQNIRSQIYAVDQAAFLAGYVAASVTRTGKVGVFGGINIPPVTDFMDGFALGVRYYNSRNGTSVEVLGWDAEKHEGLFIGGFCCAGEGRQITGHLLDQGADVIFPVAGTNVGPGAAYAVKSHGEAYIIGVDTDWVITDSEFANIILTSVMKNYDVSVVQAVHAIADGTFNGGIRIGTLETGEVGLAPFHGLDSVISPKVKAELEQIKADIIAGKIQTKP
jgi:WD40 repeat protein/basic membrane lipoprotein Med (substrate-binding protein (PBP1-ABC) superfamily)/transcriptional regulator with XRE-family HTH domain